MFPFAAQAAGKLPAPAWPKVARSGAHALKLSWEPVEGARSYAVYRYDGAAKEYARVKVTKRTSWRDAGLEGDRTYRYKVAACAKADGRAAGRPSYRVSARAYSRGARKVNPARPKTKKGSAVVALGASDTAYALASKVAVKASTRGRELGAGGCRPFSRKVRYVSGDPKVVKVTSRGYVNYGFKALRAGSCRVWAVAANGARSRPVAVTVVDATRPARFTDPGFADPEVVEWLNDEADAMSRVIRRCLATGFYTNAWVNDDGVLSCSVTGYGTPSDKTLAALRADSALLADVEEMLAHDVDGFKVRWVTVTENITLHFESDVIEHDYYEIRYVPEIEGTASVPQRVAPYWFDVYCEPIY